MSCIEDGQFSVGRWRYVRRAMALPLVALDIETTGLDPSENYVRAAAFAGFGWQDVRVYEDERWLLRWLERELSALPTETILVTWNGSEFDLPFLARRFLFSGVPTTLTTRSTDVKGKYGGTTHDASWANHSHVDIAPLYQEEATAKGLGWHLKGVARGILGVTPVDIPHAGSEIERASLRQLQRYVTSDAVLTLQLAIRLDGDLATNSLH